MSAIFERELRRLFNHRNTYLLGGLLLLLHGLFMTLYHFYIGSTRYEVILGSMTLFVAFLLPLWTVSRFSSMGGEREDGFLRMLPLTSREILLGKLLAGVTLVGGIFLVFGLFPLVLFFFGGKNLISAYAALGAGLLLGLAVLFGLVLVALLCHRRLVAYSVSYGALVLLFALTRIAALLPEPFDAVLRYLSLFGSLEPFAMAVFDWRVLLWLSAIALLLLGIVLKKMGVSFGRAVLCVALAVLLVAGAIGGAFLPARMTELDMTPTGILSLANGSRGFLSALDEDVTVYLLEDDSNDSYRDARFEAYLEKYVSYSDHLSLERLPISESGALLAEIGMTAEDVYQYCMLFKSEKRIQILDYTSMVVYCHNNTSLAALGISNEMSVSEYDYYGSALESAAARDFETYGAAYTAFMNEVLLYFKGERYLNAAIEYVTSDLIPQKYALTGHGETALSSVALGDLMADCAPLTLGEGESVPANASTVFVFAPTSDFSVSVTSALTDYLNRGGTLVLITGEENLAMPNLMGLLSSFGLSAKSGYVGEYEKTTVKDQEGKETETVNRTYAVRTAVNTNHDVLAEITTLGTSALNPRVTNGNSVSFHTTDDSSLITTPLLTTSANAFVGVNDAEKGTHTLAAAAENNRGARLVWFTGADSYRKTSEQVMDSMDYVYALACPYLAAEWTALVYQSALVPVPMVQYEEPYLRATDLHMTIFAVVSMAILPGALITVGMIRVTKRKKA